ncbi:MAG: helicase [Deltaproteobacteria bacterium]|nr:helicase [Deltaproteobacteria bacterium]
MTSAEARAHLIDLLQLDLVGPLADVPHHATYAAEVLPNSPSNWYLTGFLAPTSVELSERSDDDGDESLEQADGRPGADDEQPAERASAKRAGFPSSMGLSILVTADVGTLHATVTFGDYKRDDAGHWKRTAKSIPLDVPVQEGPPKRLALPGEPGLSLVVLCRAATAHPKLPPGTRAVSVFLVNERAGSPEGGRDASFVFQAEVRLKSPQPFVARPDLRGTQGVHSDPDDRVADLQYRDAVEYTVGHSVSARATIADGACREVRTTWIPCAEVEKVVPAQLDVELRLEALAAAPDPGSLQAMLAPLVASYGDWLDAQPNQFGDPGRDSTAADLMFKARRARARIQAGLDALSDPLAFEAFRMMNGAVAKAIRQRGVHDTSIDPASLPAPRWYPFQLAFILLNLQGIVEPKHADRRSVDLLFFPTGGGKTEAYLGLSAFTMLLRRLRDPTASSAGVTVLMRYTLRLLTLDQLGRAATLICALELLRQSELTRLGPWPFEIGLWVGQAATPNRMGKSGDRDEFSARKRTLDYKADPQRNSAPIPIESCPWCGWRFDRDCFSLLRDGRPDTSQPDELRVSCRNRGCEFHSQRQARGLPLLAVDDQIYRRLPAFVIATVDKFASLPWTGETGVLLGGARRFDKRGFYGAVQPQTGELLASALLPPELVIQDELHLISGPLGTMVGLYETAIDELSKRSLDGASIRPKIVASTATVRRATRQIQGLFGRSAVDVFPPPMPDRRNSFFALSVPATQRNARVYAGIAAPGRNLKVVLLRTYLALLSGAQKLWLEAGGDQAQPNPADPYMTLLGYFNSLRELGGSRRIVEDEVQARLADYGDRRRRVGEPSGLFANRPRLRELKELTSRVSTSQVAAARAQMSLSADKAESPDVVLATNMISVGLDITRLGLMVVLGQPKTAAEYIQATSRVGRDDQRPGLVLTLLNVHRPRDRSHYERFTCWHESFYRSVEAASVTPFSPRALDRGLPAVTVALARHGWAPMTPPRGAERVSNERQGLDFVAEALSRRAEGHDPERTPAEREALRQNVRGRVEDLLDSWDRTAVQKGDLQYYREVGAAARLLFDPLDPELANQTMDAAKFKANRSLRDVEASVDLWLVGPDGQGGRS